MSAHSIKTRDECVPYPDGHANASLDVQAARRDTLIDIRLQLQLGRSRGRVHAGVDFGVRNINAELGKALECSSQGGEIRSRTSGGSLLDRNVGLETNALDLDAVALHELDDTAGTCSLVTVQLKVVVVVEELGVGVDLGGVGESDGDVSLADRVVEHRLAVGSILIEGCRLMLESSTTACIAVNSPSFTTSQRVQLPL